MGQTLSHGVYLPAEGERNCYSGLASNWNLLDAALGDIDGKASATHTHGNITNDGKVGTTANLPLITGTGGAVQAGSFGNQANTFCEGNDSRLSDARTPVAHTHTKSDVTDLFNSANTWSASQTFTENSTFSNYITSKESAAISAGGYGKGIAFRDYQNNRLGYIQPHLTSDNEKRLVIGADLGKVALNSNTIPGANNSYDLGSSSYQWNNVYSKRVNTQTLNGINPGALSLPNLDSDGYIDLSSNISANSEYLYTPTSDGWLALFCTTTGFHTENSIGIFNREGGGTNFYRWANSVTSSLNLLRNGDYQGSVMLPVRAGVQYGCWIVINSSTTLAVKRLFFYKAKGNV